MNNHHPHHHNKPPHLPPHHHPYPPPHHRRPPPPKHNQRTRLSSCIVATIFLVFLIIILFIIYFSLFKPKPPSTTITSIQLPSFTLSSNSSSTTTVSFTFSLSAAVRNPNRATFSHYDSSLQLLYSGNQVGFMFIPAGKVLPGKTHFITAIFSVMSFPLTSTSSPENGNFPASAVPVSDGIERIKPSLELEMRLVMAGNVRVLWVFNHHLHSVSHCRVPVSIPDGSVLGFHC